MSSRPMLNAAPGADVDVAALRRQIAQLEDQLEAMEAQCKADIAKARAEINAQLRGLERVRHQLEPWYGAMKALFGEMDAVGIHSGAHSAAPANTPAPEASNKWESWKAKFGGSTAKVIDALLVSPMSLDQLVAFTSLDRRTVTNTCIYQLNNADLIDKEGGRGNRQPSAKYSLKQI